MANGLSTDTFVFRSYEYFLGKDDDSELSKSSPIHIPSAMNFRVSARRDVEEIDGLSLGTIVSLQKDGDGAGGKGGATFDVVAVVHTQLSQSTPATTTGFLL